MTDAARHVENVARDAIVRVGKSLFERGMTFGATGNISVRLAGDGWLMTPTGVSLGEPGRYIGGDKPTKESSLHLAMYGKRADAGAVVHLHSTHSVAVSILVGLDARDVLPPLTAYYVMRVGRLPLVPYFPPGDEALAKAVGGFAGAHHAMLLANHGPVVAGTTLANAQYAAEELEETAKLFLMLRGAAVRTLTPSRSPIFGDATISNSRGPTPSQGRNALDG